MSDTTNTDAGAEVTADGGEQKQEAVRTFTQAELDQMVTERLAQQAKNKFGDYAELKAKAEGAKTVEQKLAELEAKHAEAEARMQRTEIASKYGITPEDRDLFLVGSDAATLEAQAKRLAERIADTKKNGNVARNEGDTKSTGNANDDELEVASRLFSGSA